MIQNDEKFNIQSNVGERFKILSFIKMWKRFKFNNLLKYKNQKLKNYRYIKLYNPFFSFYYPHHNLLE